MNCLVTGANGHLGFALTRCLKQAGHPVRASVRDTTDPSRVGHLEELGGIEIVEADLFRPETIERAVQEIDVVFQVAAAYEFIPRTNAEEIIRTSLEGGMNVLKAARKAAVSKVVFTSSCVSVGVTPRGGPTLNESHWNQELKVPYVRAKTLAERKAWEFAESEGLHLVTVLPGAIGGPLFKSPTPTIDIIQGIRMGSVRFGAPQTNLPYVDIRDVAKAHLLAGESAAASGRYLICNDHLPSFSELAETMNGVDPQVPRPAMVLPDALLPLVPIFDRISHRIQGTPRVMTRELIHSLRGKEWKLDTGKAKRELGWRPQVSLRQSLADTLEALS
ncbi:MAG: NAD-dependent epimerase/dehydratase family protein [Acidobacteriota bacterium]|nr:MAG: NAD-dependent epimerase/dehydratase family protein [Acidobacteriota bacterium]